MSPENTHLPLATCNLPLLTMRFIVREQSYEKPVAAGMWRYERNGEPTGAVESWRLTQPTDGIELLRVDLDARDAPSGHSYLYHLIRQDNGHFGTLSAGCFERLNYRFWGDGLQVEGTVLFEETATTAGSVQAVHNLRTVNGTTYEEEMGFSLSTPFWFSSSTGLGLLANLKDGETATSASDPGRRSVQAVTLNSSFNKPSDAFQLQMVKLKISTNDNAVNKGKVQVANREQSIRPFTISWLNQTRTIWFNEQSWPLKMERNDGLTAVETRYIQYQS